MYRKRSSERLSLGRQGTADIQGDIAVKFCETYNATYGDGTAKLLLNRAYPHDTGLYQYLKDLANKALVLGPVAPVAGHTPALVPL
eukprot:COSAG06_NODE_1451_length_9435_cov_11.764353_3_plen_86_part_00